MPTCETTPSPARSAFRPPGLDAHRYIERLALDGNQLRSLRGVGATKYLVHFSAGGNQLEDTAGIGPLQRLRTLDLSGNGLRRCAELSSLCKLTSLDLSRNELATLPDLRALDGLSQVALAHNPLPSLAVITGSIGSIATLKSLTLLAGNVALSRLPDPRLRALYLFPRLQQLDGKDCTAEELVAAKSMHGDDATELSTIRAQLFGRDHIGTIEHVQLPGLLHLYSQQYTAAFISGEQEQEC